MTDQQNCPHQNAPSPASVFTIMQTTTNLETLMSIASISGVVVSLHALWCRPALKALAGFNGRCPGG